MDFNDILIEFVRWRFIERVLIIVVGAISIYFGYHLFRLKIFESQSLGIEHDFIKLNLSKVGPGVFFSLFGCALIVYVIVFHPEVENYKRDVARDLSQSDWTEHSRASFSDEETLGIKTLSAQTNTFKTILSRMSAINEQDESISYKGLSSDIADLYKIYSNLNKQFTSQMVKMFGDKLSDCKNGEPSQDDEDTCDLIKEIEGAKL